LEAFDNPHHITAAQIGALTNETDAIALMTLSAITNQTRILLDDSGVTNYARIIEDKLVIWSYTAHDATWVIQGTTTTAPLPYPLDYYGDSEWTVTLWGDVAWVGWGDIGSATVDRYSTTIDFGTAILQYVEAGVFTNINSVLAPIAQIPSYITSIADLNLWLDVQRVILTNALWSVI
jgi:hypothetical protein